MKKNELKNTRAGGAAAIARRFASIFALSVFALALFSGCSKKVAKDDYGIYSDFDSVLDAAQKSGKNVLLFFTKLEDGGFNEKIVNDVLHASDYNQVFANEFETCWLDFSRERFSKKS